MGFRSVCFLCLPFALLLHPLPTTATFNAIYQFGDSLSDTGNAIRQKSQNPRNCGSLPYGETFFHRPTGRCSDGLLMVDFLAKSFHLPLLNPYMEKNADFIHGVNFAVAGCTALDTSVLASKNITVLSTNNSLSVQLGWFRTHLKSLCSSKAVSLKSTCKHKLGKALFLVGEIGGNDYGFALGGGKSVQDLYKLVPDVVHAIKDAVNEVIDHGAAHVVVPGLFRIGCSPFILVMFASNDTSNPSIYDEFKCNKVVNEFTEFHNHKLQGAVKELQHQHPTVSISYGDLYSAFTWLLQNAASLGFEKDGVLKACCGDGNNAYNYNISRPCGSSGVLACGDPKKRVSWDEVHLTHQAYNYLTGWLLAHNLGGI